VLLLCVDSMHLQDFEGQSGEETTALLQLAMNCSNPSTAAAAAARSLPEQLEAAAARKLLLAAAARQHTAAIDNMIGLPTMIQLIDADTLEYAIAQLLPAQAVPNLYSLEQLYALPAAAQLSSEAVVRLLLEGLKQRQHISVARLCSLKLAGAQNISSAQITEVLIACAGVCIDTPMDRTAACLSVTAIGELPGVKALSSDELVQLLQAALENCPGKQSAPFDEQSAWGMVMLCVLVLRLPAAADFSTAQVMQLIRLAVQFDSVVLMNALCQEGIVGRLSSEMLLQSLQHVVEAGRFNCTAAMCSLPAVQQLDGEAVARLLQAAAHPLCTARLCELPAAAQLTCEAVAELLSSAMKKGQPAASKDHSPSSCIMPVFRLPAAQQLDSATITQWLHTAVEHGDASSTANLWELPASAEVDSAALAGLLQKSLQLGHDICTQQLCLRPAAQAFNRDQLLQVFMEAAEHGSTKIQWMMFKHLPAVAQLSPTMCLAVQQVRQAEQDSSRE
jgi:hypothetical protein